IAWFVVAVSAFLYGISGKSSEEALSVENGNGSEPVLSSRAGGGRSRGGSGGGEGIYSTAAGGGGAATQKATVARYQQETDALVANKMFADLLLELRPENAREVFDALLEKRRRGGDTGQQMGLLLEAWGKLDGEAALAAVGEMGGDGRSRGSASISAMKGWASMDPVAAKAHLDGLEGGFEKGMLTQGVVSGLASADPEAATAYVLELEAAREADGEDGNDRWRGFAVDRQMEEIARAQIQRGMSQATSWAESLPEGSIKSSAFDRVAESYAQDDPEAAAEWVKSHADQEYAERAVREISEELSRKDPAAAVSWAEELPGDSKTSAMRDAMGRWTREDPTAAGTYLTTMDESPARDAAVSSFAQSYDREDPAVAAEWAGSIGDETLRTQTLESVARSWVRSNADEAKAWLPDSGLNPELQQKVIEDATRDRGRRR
ncbi:MAG: hypothetical protein HOK04_03820, partial [Verrucomicrobia bacterium]|nr:hypothetical protein [Verrucomicrobiota bacterium]